MTISLSSSARDRLRQNIKYIEKYVSHKNLCISRFVNKYSLEACKISRKYLPLIIHFIPDEPNRIFPCERHRDNLSRGMATTATVSSASSCDLSVAVLQRHTQTALMRIHWVSRQILTYKYKIWLTIAFRLIKPSILSRVNQFSSSRPHR